MSIINITSLTLMLDGVCANTANCGHTHTRKASPPSPNLCLHQQASCKNHRVNRVVFLGNMKRLLTTGVSRWNTREIALWDQVWVTSS